MFTLRADQVALLARGFNGGQLLDGFQRLGYRGEWEDGGDEIKLVDPRGYTSRIKLDQRGRIIETQSPSGQRQQFVYDGRDRLIGYQAPTGSVLQWTYDEEDRPNSLTRNQTQHWLLESDEPGNLTAIVYPDRTFCRMAYQGLGKFVAYQDRTGAVTCFERDSLSRLTGIIDAMGGRMGFSYNKWDRPDRITYRDGTIEEHTRDANGRLISATVNGEPWAQIAWDDANRIKRIDYGDGHFVEFTYDANGQVVEAKNPNSMVTRKYDDNGRLLEENQDGHIVHYMYDAAGLLTSITNPKGETVRFSYDEDGRLSAIEDWHGKKHTVEYEHGGKTIRQRFSSGMVTEIRAGQLDRPESITTQSPQGFTLGLKYQHNVNGQVARLDDSELGYKLYQYDPEGRIAEVQQQRGGGNSAGHEITHGSKQMAYDARGNLTQVMGPKGKTRYFYNGQNLLLIAELPDRRRVEYRYDAFGRRISKTVDGSIYTRYIWASDQLLCEITEEGSYETRCDYLFLPGAHIPFALRRNGRVCFYHTDALGTPRWLTDESGWLVWSGDYSPLGEVRMLNQQVPQPLRFPGHYYDQETGLHYNRARYYSPQWGQYLSRDPLDLVSGFNFYAYADNDPINEADPLGLLSGWAKIVLGIGIAALGAAVVVVAAPAIIAVTAGAAVTAATGLAVAGVVAGGAAIGAGIALTLSPDGCLQCQVNNMIRGAAAGMAAALAMLTLPFSGPAAGAFALAGGGTLAASTMTAAVLSVNVIGVSAAAGIVSMMSSTSSGGGSGEKAEQTPEEKKSSVDQKAVDDWKNSLKTREPAGKNMPEARDFQIRNCGDEEYLAEGGTEKVWTDGIDTENGMLQDAKYVGDPEKSPFVSGSNIPDKIRSQIDAGVEDEFKRYASVINDPNTPVKGLEVITNEPRAVPYFQNLMEKYGIPGNVVVKP